MQPLVLRRVNIRSRTHFLTFETSWGHWSVSGIPFIFPCLCLIPNMYLISHGDFTLDSLRPARDSLFTFDLLLSSLAGELCFTLY